MSRALFLGTLLLVGPFLSMAWAQDKTAPTETGPILSRKITNDISMGLFLLNGIIPAWSAELAHSNVRERVERAR